MESQNNASRISENTSTPSAPIFVIMFSCLLLVEAITKLLGGVTGSLPLSSLVFGTGVFALLELTNLVSAIVNIVIAVGLWKMKKWALYLIAMSTALLALLYIYQELTSTFNSSFDLVDIVISGMTTIYLWSIRKQLN